MSHQETIDSLMESCESLYLRSVAMESILDKLAPEDWRHIMDRILNSEEAFRVRTAFRYRLRAVVHVGDPTEVLGARQPKPRRPH